MPENQNKHLFAALDALRWLEWQAKENRAVLWSAAPSRYRLDRILGQHFFTLSYDEQGDWFLGALDIPAMKWFARLPWKKAYIHQNTQPNMVTLVCASIHVPAVPSINFEGGDIPMFSVDILGDSKLLSKIEANDRLKIGLFTPDPKDPTRRIAISPDDIGTVPAEVRQRKTERRNHDPVSTQHQRNPSGATPRFVRPQL